MRGITTAMGVLALLAGLAGPAAARPNAAQKCAASKMRCVGKEFATALACYGKAVLAGAAVDAGCLAKAQSMQGTCWQKAESKGGCLPSFPADHLHGDVADWTADIASDLPGS